MVTSGLNKILGQLEIAQNFDRNFTAKCHCDEAIKELRRLPRKKKEKVQIFRRPKIGGQMGLDKIRALARDPFAFMWNVRHFTTFGILPSGISPFGILPSGILPSGISPFCILHIWHFTILHLLFGFSKTLFVVSTLE